MTPIVYDLYCGLGGWSEGFLAEGYECIGFDIEAHMYWVPDQASTEDGIKAGDRSQDGKWSSSFADTLDGRKGTKPVEKRGWTQGCAVSLGLEGATARPCTKLLKYPGKLILRDVRSIHGSELKDATVIVASPPCQAYSYRAMPWKRAKALPPPDNTLFNECFRIQREASEAAGHYIPLIVENVRGAQKWVGRARWNYGSFYLWGDVPALMPIGKHSKLPKEINESIRQGKSPARWTNPDEHHFGRKEGGDWRNKECRKTGMARLGSKSKSRKAASAMIAKIPFPLSQHIARTFKP